MYLHQIFAQKRLIDLITMFNKHSYIISRLFFYYYYFVEEKYLHKKVNLL